MRTLLLPAIVLLWLLSRPASAQGEAPPPPPFLPLPAAELLALYERPFTSLTESQQWRIRIHGVRLTPLHPVVWGALRRERTDNRRLVPIKRFFLRASAESDFALSEARIHFAFRPANPRYMAKMPHQKDPVFEIGFGGRFAEERLIDPPLMDRFYALRLSAFERVRSGLFIRDQEEFEPRDLTMAPRLEVGRPYTVLLQGDSSGVRILLDGHEIARLPDESAARGLIYLQTSWHPITLTELTITGDTRGKRQTYSGLVRINGSR